MKSLKRFVVMLMILLPTMSWAENEQRSNRPYKMEVGVQAGTAYYIGDAAKYPFMQPRWTAGGQLRYKFDKRWSLAAHATYSEVTIPAFKVNEVPLPIIGVPFISKATKNVINADITAEFNFLPLSGRRMYFNSLDYTFSPYVFLGIGGMAYKDVGILKYTGAPYMPFGIGLKWMFGGRYGLNVRWQHNLLLGYSNLEGIPQLDKNLKGSDITNFDMTGQLMVGFIIEFAIGKRVCKMC